MNKAFVGLIALLHLVCQAVIGTYLPMKNNSTTSMN